MDGTATPQRDPLGNTYVPTTRPGHRLPHAWLECEGSRFSTLDLVQPGRFLVITGETDSPWSIAAQAFATQHGLSIDVVDIGEDTATLDVERRWRVLREVSRQGAVLVRPDQHVGWRAMGALPDPQRALAAALGKILQRDLVAA